MRQVGQARGQLGALTFANHRNQDAHLGGDAFDGIYPLADRLGQLGALALARDHEAGHHLLQQRQRLCLQRGGVHVLYLQDAGQLQQVGEADLQFGEQTIQPRGQRTQLL